MKLGFRSLAAATLALALALPAAAQSFTPEQRGEIEKIVREYLLNNPQILQEVMAELEKRQALADAEKHSAAIKEHAGIIFDSPRQVTLGNPQGDVAFVEFLDYNCGYCKRALTDMLDLMKADAKVKVVLKEFPVLGEASTHAAQVAVAVRMQDRTGGKKYLEFHQKLLTTRGQVDRSRDGVVWYRIGHNFLSLNGMTSSGCARWAWTGSASPSIASRARSAPASTTCR